MPHTTAATFTLTDCIVLHGPELEPRQCAKFTVRGDTIAEMDLGEPCNRLDGQGALVIIPGLTNGHTHMGDSCLPDGATGLTLEQGFFRPDGYKYRELALQTEESHLAHIVAHLRYMARSGTIRHLDFREQGAHGSRLLRRASEITGVQSVILGQFNSVPFDAAALRANSAALAPEHLDELNAILDIADGFSESTMNDLTDPAWRQIRDLTRDRSRLRAIHCLENAAYRDTSLALTGRGDLVRAISLLDPHLIVHLTEASPEEIALLVRAHKTGVLNPRANANLGLRLPPVAALLEAGANLLLGTDNGLLATPNLLAELDFTYKIAKSQYGDSLRPDPAAILKMATSNIQQVLGDDHPGHLALGFPADFVVVNFHQPHLRASRHLLASLLHRVTPEDILLTVRRGQELHRAPDFTAGA